MQPPRLHPCIPCSPSSSSLASYYYSRQSCVGDKFYAYTDALHAQEAHSRHYAPSPRLDEDRNFLPYVGNGHVGVEIAAASANLYVFGRRHLNVKVRNCSLIFHLLT